jgi:hypothetical protein
MGGNIARGSQSHVITGAALLVQVDAEGEQIVIKYTFA